MPVCIKCKKDIPQGASFCPWCGTPQEEPQKRPVKKRTHGNGQGTVFRLGASWCAEWTIKNDIVEIDGIPKLRQQRKRKMGFQTKRAAQEYLAAAIADMKKPAEEKKKEKTVSDLFEEYKDAGMPSVKKNGKISATKQTAYNIAFEKRINPAFGNVPISQLQIKNIESLIEPLTHYQAKDCKDLLSVLFKRAMAEGYATANLTDYVVLPENNSEEVQPWNTEEIEKLWNAWGEGDRIAGANLLMIYTGMMPGEMLALKKDMIHWEENQIVGAGLKTSVRKEKPIVFPDFIKPVLRDLCHTSQSLQGYVLGMNKDRFYDEFANLKNRLGIRENVRPYSGRHSTHVSLAVSGVAPALIVKIMRQRNYKTSLHHYNQIEQNELLTALNSLKLTQQ